MRVWTREGGSHRRRGKWRICDALGSDPPFAWQLFWRLVHKKWNSFIIWMVRNWRWWWFWERKMVAVLVVGRWLMKGFWVLLTHVCGGGGGGGRGYFSGCGFGKLQSFWRASMTRCCDSVSWVKKWKEYQKIIERERERDEERRRNMFLLSREEERKWYKG